MPYRFASADHEDVNASAVDELGNYFEADAELLLLKNAEVRPERPGARGR